MDGLNLVEKNPKLSWFPKNVSPIGPTREFLLGPLYIVMTRKTFLCWLRCPVVLYRENYFWSVGESFAAIPQVATWPY